LSDGEKKFFPIIMQKISKITVPDQEVSTKIPIFGTLGAFLTNIQVNINPITEQNVQVQFVEPNSMQLNVVNASAKGHFDARFQCSIFKESESIDFYLTKLNLSAKITLTMKESPSEKGKFLPQASISGFNIDIDFDFDIHGKLIAQFLKLIKPLIKNLLFDKILGALRGTIQNEIQKSVDKLINKLSIYIPVPQTSLALDYSLLSSPKVSNKFFIISITGALVDLDIPETKNPPFPIPDNIPEFDPLGKEIQVIISEFSIKTILNTLHKSDRLKFNLKSMDVPKDSPIQLNTTSLNVFLPGLTRVYGRDKLVEFFCSTTKNSTSPSVSFKHENVEGFFAVTCGLNVQLNDTIYEEAFKFNTEFDFSSQLYLCEKGELHGRIKRAFFNNSTLLTSKIPEMSMDTLEGFFNFAMGIGIPIINEKFLKNYFIPLPVIEGVEFSDSKMQIRENYIEFFLNPKYQ